MPAPPFVILVNILLKFTCIQVHIFVTRHLPRGHSISCPTHELERTIKISFTGLKGLRHVTTSQTVTHHSRVARHVTTSRAVTHHSRVARHVTTSRAVTHHSRVDVPLVFRSLAETFKNNIYLGSSLLLFDRHSNVKVEYMM